MELCHSEPSVLRPTLVVVVEDAVFAVFPPGQDAQAVVGLHAAAQACHTQALLYEVDAHLPPPPPPGTPVDPEWMHWIELIAWAPGHAPGGGPGGISGKSADVFPCPG
jgi:hypothetical protein